MEINDLIIFKTVASEGSISKAAIQLGYVQPNISERIKKLEQELETPLLHRNTKGISLLPSGEVLLQYTDRILNLLEEAKHEIKMDFQTYRIATTQSILSGYLSERIKENFNSYQIYMENSEQLKRLLKKQSVDIVITYQKYSDQDFQKVYSTAIAMGLQKAKGKTHIDYSTEIYFVSHDKLCPYRNRTIKFMEDHSISKKLLHQVDSYPLIKEFVGQGKGLAFLPVDRAQLEAIEEVQLVHLPLYFYTLHKSEKKVPVELFS